MYVRKRGYGTFNPPPSLFPPHTVAPSSQGLVVDGVTSTACKTLVPSFPMFSCCWGFNGFGVYGVKTEEDVSPLTIMDTENDTEGKK